VPRPRNPVPSYRLHKSSGQAVVTLRSPDGRRKDVMLGRFDSPESKAEYARIIAEWQTSGGAAAGRDAGPGQSLTVNEMLLAYLRHVDRYYVHPDGTPTGEGVCIRSSLKPVRTLYGHTPAMEFGPLALKAVRRSMIDADLARTVVNARVNRVRRAFKWAASEELIPFTAYQSLTTVRGLGAGRGEARETEPVKPVDPAEVERILPFLPPAPAAMVRLQMLTGMRPGEIVRLKRSDVDRSGPVWTYTPKAHKTAYRGRTRTVFMGPKAQAVLAPWLAKAGDGPVFSPERERDERYARLRAARRTKVQPSQASRKRPGAVRLPADRYTVGSYGRAVVRAVEKANQSAGPDVTPVPPWRPNRIRHTFGTNIRRRFGLEAAQVLLGHARADVTQVYAERDTTLAERVAAEAG
jgi:integrase